MYVDSLSPDIICIPEHWLQENKINNYTLLNYTIAEHYGRNNKINGSVMIYT